jgi:hypothetical protein
MELSFSISIKIIKFYNLTELCLPNFSKSKLNFQSFLMLKKPNLMSVLNKCQVFLKFDKIIASIYE